MKKAFEKNSTLPLAERLVSSLEAAEEAGGDIRGKQSSAILVVSAEPKPNQWEGRLVDLRVEDHVAPVPELKRLLRYQRGYEWANKGDDFLTARDYPNALDAYAKAFALVPEIDELKYWVGIGLLASGEAPKGEEVLKEVIAKDSNWAQVTRGIAKVGSPPIARDVLKRFLNKKA